MRITRLIAVALLTICPFAANAEFIDRGNGMIYDELLDITWLKDANYAMTSGYDADGLMTWDAANAWAASLTVGGVSGWRLPTMTTPGSPRPNENGQDVTGPTRDNEFGWLWYQLNNGEYISEDTDISPFTNLPLQVGEYLSTDEWYWTSEEIDGSAWRMSMNCACWDYQDKQTEWHAWAVHDGDVALAPEPVTIDIKPGSDPNCFNINGHGVIPVAVLGDAAFDVATIDVSTLSFGGLDVRVRGNKGPMCNLDDVNLDGFYDLVCQFEDIPDYWEPGEDDATLTGTLLDGTSIEGTDSICIVP